MVSHALSRPAGLLTPWRTVARRHIKAAKFTAPSNTPHRALPPAEFTILASHGNAEDLSTVMDTYETLAYTLGCDVFAYEYVGCESLPAATWPCDSFYLFVYGTDQCNL
jgi:hypothetical protein